MLKYNKEKIDASLILAAFSKWNKLNMIDAQKVDPEFIRSRVPYKKYSLIKRIGLYLVSALAAQAGAGFFMLVFAMGLESLEVTKALLLLSGIGFYFILETITGESRIYKQGSDDALLHTAVVYIISALFMILNLNLQTIPSLLGASFIVLIVTLVSTLRYADSLLAVIATAMLNIIPVLLVALIDTRLLFFSALMLFPFNILIIRFFNQKDKLIVHYYNNVLMAARIVCCIFMYFSVNLFVIRSLAFRLMGAIEIPFQWLFLVLTIAFPFGCIVSGLLRKEKYLVITGLLLLVLSVSTVRYYYSVMPLEVALLIGGMLLIVVCYLSITYLKKDLPGYTFEEDPDEDDLSAAETLLIIQQFGQAQHPAVNNGTEFGGGKFGGAGSGGDF